MSTGKKVFVGVVILLIVLVFCCFLVFLFSVVTSLASGGNLNGQILQEGDSLNKVAVIDINGVISSVGASDLWGNYQEDMVSKTIRKLDMAIEDDNVKGVILRVDSPGGEVYGSKQIYNKILQLKESDKKIVVLMQSQAASGGYYISAPADKIIASEMTLTGSIGVVFSGFDLSELYSKIGVQEITVVNSKGNLKVLGGLSDKESEGYQILQSVADDYYDNFITVVSEGRNMTKDEVIKIADGRVYSGKQALEVKLVDKLGEDAEALAEIKLLIGFDNPQVVIYQDYSSPFVTASTSILNMIIPGRAIVEKVQENPSFKAYYLTYY